MTKTKKLKPTRAELSRRILELEGQLAGAYGRADRALENAGDALHASGVLLQLTALGGRPIVEGVVIVDGLSAATIAALRGDLRRSYTLATMERPKERKP